MAGRRGPKGRRGGDASGALSRSAGFDDIPKDDEDLFEASRDQILLDGYDRAAHDSDDDMDVGLNNREVLGIDEAPSDEDQDSDLDDEQDQEDYDDDDEEAYPAQKTRKGKKADIVVSSDDDDDFDNDDEDDEEEEGEDGQEPHENDRGWGTNKRAYYNTNDLDAMDSDSEIDEEQARELELKEVKRLQKKSRSAMDDSDFGLGGDDADDRLAKSAKDAGREQRRRELDGDDSTTSTLPRKKASTAAASTDEIDESTRRALLAKLQQTSPEAVALAGEYADMLEEFGRAHGMLKNMLIKHPGHVSLQVMHVYYQTLATYITTMTFYFHLRTSAEFVSEPAKLRTHPVMQRMMRLKQGLSIMEDLGLRLDHEPKSATKDELSSEEVDEMYMLSQGSEDDDLGDLDEDELADLMADAEASSGKENAAPVKAKKNANKSKKQALRDAGDDDADYEELMAEPKQKKAKKAAATDKNKKKAAKVKKPEPVAPLAAGLADLDDEPTLQVKLKKKSGAGKSAASSNPFAVSGDGTNFDDATFGELSGLSSIESAERAARKRSLQFHASAIESKALQRSKAAKERQSGDADIPYRDRERSRAGVEAAKAARESKLQQQLNGGVGKDVALDGEDGWGETDEKDWRDVMGQPIASSRGAGGADNDEGDDDDADYYDLVASSRKRARAEAKAEYDEARNAERFALMEDDVLEDGQHRAITRQIEKNKGLTPHRPKTSRNPRVKKRLKYEAAKKKLGSRQAVFKGGQSTLQGGYGGEASGISTHLVKSRKLG
ncbi:related to SAS10-involved in silencing [Sporisorium reilianum f. sp. reilianum]|uniref:Related to SAS10-involved in silencing n=1 Tax=Sporisorium reilianum f. sp. reilianum TaxID=72559 RepID=A0A2N8U7Z5_9BASI|nr:related to SAS10-involved in silencing [Sporisorium reilianum f. sp. reilianum]